MKIFILRHEDRDINDPLFYSPLTDKGMIGANNLVNKLKLLNISNIYASPFLRVVQTIYPYCEENNKKINIDNSLYESLDNNLFNETNSRFTWKDLPNTYKSIINKEYQSIGNIPKLNESFRDVCIRVIPFIQMCIKQNENILIVSHLTVCNAIQNYFDNTIENKNEIEMGEFKEISIN